MRTLLVLLAVIASACASAGSSGTADAAIDGNERKDSSLPIDAFVNSCPTTDTCQTAVMLGMVSGDTGNMKLMAMGYRNSWFRVRVTEDNSSSTGLTLRVASKLTSPAAVDFDTFVYVNPGSDVVECTSTTGTVTSAGNTDTVKAEWGEGIIPNGSSDSRNVTIEVRHKSGQCMNQYNWQLEIEGNWI